MLVDDSPGTVTDHEVYRPNMAHRALIYVIFGFMTVIGVPLVVSFASGNGGVMVFMLAWLGILVFNGCTFLGSARQIEVLPDRVRFIGWRTQEIPWDGLPSISSRWNDVNRYFWLWDWDGGRVTTVRALDDRFRLLKSVEAHAPQVEIRV